MAGMVETMRTLDELKKELKENAERNAALAALWQAVEYKKKKNGEDFAAVGNAFNNARLYKDPYSLGGGNLLSVSGHIGKTYIKDEIKTRQLAEDHPEITDPARLIKLGYIKDQLDLTPAELYAEIQKKIQQHNKSAAAYLAQLEKAEQAYNEIKAHTDAIKATLSKYHGAGIFPEHLYYSLRDIVKNNI